MEIKREVEGGAYIDKLTEEVIVAICWQKDGDHPLVERYPIEGREFKGILVVGPKDKHSLRFGDWICEEHENPKKRMWVVSAEAFPERYEPFSQEPPKKGAKKQEKPT
jgi:hypothetical protein